MGNFILSAFADEASMDFDQQLATLREEGISRIELRFVDGISCADLTLEQADAIKAKLDAAGIRLSALGSPYGKYPIDQPFEPHLTAFRHGLELCRRLDCDKIRMFSFFMAPEDGDRYENEVFARLEQMLDAAEAAGIALIHENEKGIYGCDTTHCLRLMERFGDRMGFVFDPANFIQCGVQPLDAFAVLEPYITYLHIKDALAANGAVVRAGHGDGHVDEILRQLKETRNGDLLLTIEPHLTVFNGLEDLQRHGLTYHETYASQQEAFHAACEALRALLAELEVTV